MMLTFIDDLIFIMLYIKKRKALVLDINIFDNRFFETIVRVKAFQTVSRYP